MLTRTAIGPRHLAKFSVIHERRRYLRTSPARVAEKVVDAATTANSVPSELQSAVEEEFPCFEALGIDERLTVRITFLWLAVTSLALSSRVLV